MKTRVLDRRLAVLAVVPTALALLTACSSGDSGTAGSGSGSASSSPTASSGPSAQEILESAKKASAEVTAVRVVGDVPDDKQVMTVDLRATKTGPSRGDITLKDGRLQVYVFGSTAYLKANNAFWKSAAGAQAARVLSGKYLKTPATSQEFKEFTSLIRTTSLFEQMLEATGGTLTKGEETQIRGVSAVGLTDGSGQTLYVATQGPSYVLQVKDDKHVLDFLDYNKPITVQRPPASKVINVPG